MTQLFDTHAHYDDVRFDQDRDQTLQGLAGAGVALVLNPGADLESSRRAAALAEQYDFLYAAAGVHPHSASEFDDGQRAEIVRLLERPRVKALGEIGLDYHYDFSPREAQKKAFESQLALAREMDVPVIIHEREAAQDCLEIIRASGIEKAVYHCYSGSLETAKTLVNMGFYLSFTGVITFKNNRKAPDILRWLPQDRIMIETDSPYMAPEPYRGRRNDSTLLPYINRAVANYRGIAEEEAARVTMENGKRFFGIAE